MGEIITKFVYLLFDPYCN